MKHFYCVRSRVLKTHPPAALYHAIECPDDATYSLVVVEEWHDAKAQDAWEVLDGVAEYPIWSWGQPTPSELQTGLKSLGVTSTDSFGAAMKRLRRVWPAARL